MRIYFINFLKYCFSARQQHSKQTGGGGGPGNARSITLTQMSKPQQARGEDQCRVKKGRPADQASKGQQGVQSPSKERGRTSHDTAQEFYFVIYEAVLAGQHTSVVTLLSLFLFFIIIKLFRLARELRSQTLAVLQQLQQLVHSSYAILYSPLKLWYTVISTQCLML